MKLSRYLTTMVGVAAFGAIGVVMATDQVDIGKQEYDANCAVCHGPSGKGDGPYAGVLKIPVPDMTTLAQNNGGVFPASQIYNLIDGRSMVQGHGPRDMPVWGEDYLASAPRSGSPREREEFVRARILALVDYLNRLQAK